MNLDALLAPVSEEAPAGADLSYDPERQTIESAFEPGAVDVDWRDTLRLIEAQALRTKDAWLAVYWTRAGARLGNLEAVEDGLKLLAGLFEQYWDSVYPSLAEYGVPGRKGPCESLTRIGEFLGPLKRTKLMEHQRLGAYSGEDFERFARDADSAEGYGLWRAALEDTPKEALQQAIDRLDGIRDALRRADAVLTEKAAAEGETGTNFQTTYEALEAIRSAVTPHAGLVSAADEEAEATAGEEAAEGQAAQPRGVGRIDSRDDVTRALDAIGDYYARREPSSPVPIVLRRVKGWVTMDFLAILKDIAPNSTSDANNVLLAREQETRNAGW